MNKITLPASVLDWLLAEDPALPSIRFLTRRDLLDEPVDQLKADQQQIMRSGAVPAILAQQTESCWVKPGPGYAPKYKGTVWAFIMLAMLGADGQDERIRAAANYLLEEACSPHGGFSMNGTNSGMIHCLQGNLVTAMLDLGFREDPRLQQALDWLARSVTGENIALYTEKKAAVRYLRSGNSGPGFLCSANGHLPCAWGAVKAMLALVRLPAEKRTPAIEAAIQMGIDFLFSQDPASAAYPMAYNTKPNRSWFQFGFPLGYVTDVLQIMEVLCAAGYGSDARLQNSYALLLERKDAQGRWPMQYTYNGKTWVDIETKNEPSKWVTLRALRVLKQSGRYQPERT